MESKNPRDEIRARLAHALDLARGLTLRRMRDGEKMPRGVAELVEEVELLGAAVRDAEGDDPLPEPADWVDWENGATII
jgi:hypothetical protein